jgi:hypothetical protein
MDRACAVRRLIIPSPSALLSPVSSLLQAYLPATNHVRYFPPPVIFFVFIFCVRLQ